MSPGNLVKFNQSDGDFKTPQVLTVLCTLCISW